MGPGRSAEPTSGSERLVAVAVPAPTRRLFTYRVPERLVPRARAGVRVRVPFGGRRVTGVLVGAGVAPESGVTLQEIAAVLDDAPALPASVLELTRWAADQYLASWGATLRAALPAGLDLRVAVHLRLTDAGRAGSASDPLLAAFVDELHGLPESQARRRFGAELDARLAAGSLERCEHLGRPRGERRGERWLELSDPPPAEGGERPAPARARLLALLRREGPTRADRARRQAGVSAATVRAAVAGGWVRAYRKPSAARPALPEGGRTDAPELTGEQRGALAAIRVDLDAGRFAVHLIEGVTGSGKTEIYLHAMRRVLERGRRALVLVPEIGLAPLLARAVRARFGAVLGLVHSGLPDDQRLAEWRRIRSGEAKVVLGARSAVFAPLDGLGLVVVDEEHDPAFKQEEAPRYHGRDLAIVRARREGAVVLLGSATPSLESWERAQAGKYRLSRLRERIGGRPLPDVEFVDLREEFRETGSDAPLSRRLREALADALARREQAIVLINRRGYSTVVLCRECGEPAACPACAVSLTYHRPGERLRCHYCGHTRPRPERCEACDSLHLHFGGEGTQRVERHLARALPGARVLRLDRDTVRGREGAGPLLARFEKGEADVLVGTQMVAKGHDFPGVTLVGVLAADAMLGFPDFRAAERTYQLVTQVAGRSGRGERAGRVVVQAFRPDHPALRFAAKQDHAAFATREARYRRTLSYPPFVSLARVVVSDRDAERAMKRGVEAARSIQRHGEGRVSLLGPSPAPLARLRGAYRVHLLVRARARGRLVAALGAMLDELFPDGRAPRGLIVDVDPLTLL